jgi:hypothetical protein
MKRKIYFVLISIVAVFLINYGLWFAHTRVINESIRQLRKSLASYGIKLNYKDLHYKTFAFWNVKTNITDLRLSGGWRGSKHKFIFERLTMISNPLDKTVSISVDGNIKIIEDTIIGNSKKNIVFESVPVVKLVLKKSLKNAWERDSIFDVIGAVDLQTDHIYVHDENDQLFSTIKQVAFHYSSDKNGNINISGDKLGRKLNGDYVARTKLEEKAIEHAKLLGSINENFKLKIARELSDKDDKALQEKFGDAYDQSKLPDTYDHLVHLTEFNYANDIYTLTCQGNARIYENKPLPDINLSIYMNKFDSFLHQTFKDVDMYIDISNEVSRARKLPALSVQKQEEIKNYLVSQTDSAGDGVRKLDVNFSNKGTMTIGKVPMPIFISSFLEIFKEYIEILNPSTSSSLENSDGLQVAPLGERVREQ